MLGIPKDNIFILKSGNVLEVSEKEAKVVDNVHTGEILVDGLGVGDVGNIVLRDRQHLAEDGIMIVVLTLEKGKQSASCRSGYCIAWIRLCKRVRKPDGRGKESPYRCSGRLSDTSAQCRLEQDQACDP